ncbi:hypothetical protein [Sphingopyxis sp. USTB-05]|nr:hypothetical protein [Sphingopyxis sp. USTB-05]USI79091.1 hypothetical protein KEC45_09465 [Sphingopyxis sp. USTB-05]
MVYNDRLIASRVADFEIIGLTTLATAASRSSVKIEAREELRSIAGNVAV